MNRLVRFLADFCGAHVLDEKIFVVPSHTIGYQIGQSLARTAGSWINLRFLSCAALAQEIAAAEMEAKGMSELTDTEVLSRLAGLFRTLKSERRLGYFHRLEPVPGVLKALHAAIRSLRLAGIRAGDLEVSSFRIESKGRDLVLLLRLYEELLERENVVDRPGLLSLALETRERTRGRTDGFPWILCLRDRTVGRVEEDLLRAVGGERLVLVPGDPVFGLDRPALFWPADPAADGAPRPPESDSGRLSWLFDPRSAPPPIGDGTLDLFRAVGPTNECREVLRRVLAENTLFDDVEIIHPPGDVYPAVFHLLAQKERFPATFAEGIPVTFTSAGRAFYGLADWLENGFLVRDLCDLVRAGDIVLPGSGEGGVAPPEAVCRHLMGAGIVRGRARYHDRLEALKRSHEDVLHREGSGGDEDWSEDKAESHRRTTGEIERLEGAVDRLLDMFTGIDPEDAMGPADLRLLGDGLIRALKDSVAVKSDLDGPALDAVADRIQEATGIGAGSAPTETLPLAEALDRLRAFISSLSVGASAPFPGHLHVSSFSSGGFSGRPVTFVVGLGEGGMSGRALQDPILLDGERRAISRELPTSADRLRRDLFSVAALLASQHGRVVLSYPSYDILEERAAFPSSLVLQALRLLRGDPDLDYTDLDDDLEEAAGFLPRDIAGVLDETDWWFARLGRDGRLLDGLAAVRDSFPGIRCGLDAAEARNGERLTFYDGIVRLDRRRHDPVSNRAIVLSASRLERLAKCPYSYFLHDVLKVAPPEILDFDPSRWLNPKQRGTLIHEILFRFMSELRRIREAVDKIRHGSLMEETAARVLDDWKRTVPPPSEAIFAKERKDIREALEVFLVAESARRDQAEPLEFEKRFTGIEIPVGAGRSFLLRGVIDRIDRLGPDLYRIVDYKTGSPSTYKDLVEFGRGRIIQHALYALAVEDLFGDRRRGFRAKVKESGYCFPTRRGEGREIMVVDFDRKAFERLLADLLNLVARGFFIAGTGDECGFCDYAPVCEQVASRSKARIEANPEIREAYERLNRYE